MASNEIIRQAFDKWQQEYADSNYGSTDDLDYSSFSSGYQAALASLDAVTILSTQHPDGIETIYRVKESKIPMCCQTHRAAHQDSPTKPASS